MSVLIVEDDVTSAKIIELTLKRYGYSYHLSENGYAALSHLANNIDVKLVVSDIMMPDMDGLELLSKMKAAREMQGIPVIMCTTKADVDTVKQAVKLGCNDYIIKPVNPLQLIKKIERILENEDPIITHYRDLVLETRMDRHTYAERIKSFATLLAESTAMLEEFVKKLKLMPPGQLNEFTVKCGEVGAVKLHQVLEASQDLLDQKTGTRENALAEMRFILREMKILQLNLPY
jgi:DNA-binding NtrC family response regulator